LEIFLFGGGVGNRTRVQK